MENKAEKIKVAQISPFDYCNNKCWYCPVKYYEQPKEAMVHMPPELFEKIIKNLAEEKGKLVSEKFDFIYTAHYNEIILYKYLGEMLETLRRYGIKTMILSNGVAFTKDRLELIQSYKDVIAGINFNIPSFEKESWSSETGQPESSLDNLIKNVEAVFSEFGQIVSVGMNGTNPSTMAQRVGVAKNIFPGTNIYPVVGLCDRAGLLVDAKVLSNLPEIENNKKDKSGIVGCRNAERPSEWLHVNALGKTFLCCDDYFFKYEFGDFNKQTLSEIWNSPERIEAMKKGISELCSRCAFAVWK